MIRWFTLIWRPGPTRRSDLRVRVGDMSLTSAGGLNCTDRSVGSAFAVGLLRRVVHRGRHRPALCTAGAHRGPAGHHARPTTVQGAARRPRPHPLSPRPPSPSGASRASGASSGAGARSATESPDVDAQRRGARPSTAPRRTQPAVTPTELTRQRPCRLRPTRSTSDRDERGGTHLHSRSGPRNRGGYPGSAARPGRAASVGVRAGQGDRAKWATGKLQGGEEGEQRVGGGCDTGGGSHHVRQRIWLGGGAGGVAATPREWVSSSPARATVTATV